MEPQAQAASGVDGLAFTVIGDWGGNSVEEPTTESQRETAMGMMRRARESKANFSLLVGDNFYQHGIDEAAEETCRFRQTFEEVYARVMPDLPFYVCAGNHDYGEGIMANVSSQLAYSELSAQWRFPSLWYKIHQDFTADGKRRSLDLLMIDTVVLCGNGAGNEAYIDKQLEFLGAQELPKDSPGQLRQAVAERQWAWLEGELQRSAADFLLVAGHYPIWSAGYDGSSQCLIERLRPMMMQHGAHYLSGHDHMLEHFDHDGLNTFVVGAGKECCYPPVKLDEIPPGAMRYMLAGDGGRLSQPTPGLAVHGGFAAFTFDADHMRVALYAHDGSTLYEAPPIERRWRAVAVAQPAAEGSISLASAWPWRTSAAEVAPWAPLLVALAAASWAAGFLCSGRPRLPAQSGRSRRVTLDGMKAANGLGRERDLARSSFQDSLLRAT